VKYLPCILIFIFLSTPAFAQDRGQTRVNIQHSSGGTREEQRFFDENLRMEVSGEGFSLAANPGEADYTIEYSIRPEGSDRVLVCTLTNPQLGDRMVSEELLYTKLVDTYEVLPFVVWTLLANAPLKERTPPSPVTGEPVYLPGIREEVRIIEREGLAEPDDVWKYHWLFLNARIGGSFRMFLSENSGVPNSSALGFDLGFESEFHVFNFLALQFGINYGLDKPEYLGLLYEDFPVPVVYPSSLLSIPLMVKGIFNPTLRSTLGPYAGAYLTVKIIGSSKPPLLGVLGGVEYATKLVPGALFFDLRYSQDIGSTEVADGLFNYRRLFITLSVGYKYGFFERRH
jgi:hypothetical protein